MQALFACNISMLTVHRYKLSEEWIGQTVVFTDVIDDAASAVAGADTSLTSAS